MIDPQKLLGSVIDGHYQLASVISEEGSYGVVFCADELVLGEPVGQVAVKLMRPKNDEERSAVLREVKAMAQLSQEYLIAYRNAGNVPDGPAEGSFYIAMELAEESLSDKLKRSGRLKPKQATIVTGCLASALKFLHGRQAVHRDIKPGNVLRVGDSWKLADMGLARGFEGTSARASGRKGTVIYMSPEAVKGETGPHVDMWALGVLLQECLTGALPFTGDSEIEYSMNVFQNEPAIAADIPRPFEAIVRGCLAKDRKQRWTAGQVIDALTAPAQARVVAHPQIHSRPRLVHATDWASGVVLSASHTKHTAAVVSVAFSPDGNILASGGLDNTVRLWDVTSGKQLRSFTGHDYFIRSIAFSPDGKCMATGSADKTVKLWEISTSRQLHSFRGHTGYVRSVCFSPNGNILATASADKTARLWDISSGKQLYTFEGHDSHVTSVVFSADGKYLATGSDDETAALWEISTKKLWRIFRRHFGIVFSVDLSYDGEFLVTGGSAVRLWEVSSGKHLRSFDGHTDWIHSVAFSPDGKTLATGSQDETAKLWEVSTGYNLCTINEHKGIVWSAVFSPEGGSLATASGDFTAKLWLPKNRIRGNVRVQNFAQAGESSELNIFDQKKRDFLLGREAHRDIVSESGELIIAKGATFDDEALKKLWEGNLLNDIFIELTLKK